MLAQRQNYNDRISLYTKERLEPHRDITWVNDVTVMRHAGVAAKTDAFHH